ncbi:hypothetical protein FRC06_003851 [Ceratobasidium sp. 370]|nr:hypothetical protein FRC06_003851 [Ceratobasidium sp. 370]
MALDIEEQWQIENMPDRDNIDNVTWIRRHLFQSFPPLGLCPLVQAGQVNYESFVGQDTNAIDTFHRLIALRAEHETSFVKKSVRTGHTLKPEVLATTVTDGNDANPNASVSPNSARLILIKKVHSTLRSIQDMAGSTSGVAKRARHEGRVETAQAGNSANAAEASNARGNEALKAQVCAFKEAKLTLGAILGTGGVTVLNPIQTGSYAFVMYDKQVWFAKVLMMYSKGGGKAGKHGWVNKQINLASVSNVLVQLWEHWMDNNFFSVPKRTAAHYAKRYAHLRSQHILYVLSLNEKLEVQTDQVICLNGALSKTWKVLNHEREKIRLVVDDLLRRRRKANKEGDDD